MKYHKHTIVAFLSFVIIGVPWLVSFYPQSAKFIDTVFEYVGNNMGGNFASLLLRPTISVAELKDKYTSIDQLNKKIRIFIVPGHEPDYGGAEYGDIKERDIVVDLAKDLEKLLKDNSHYEVVISRNKDNWNPDLQRYFTEHWNEIVDFQQQSRAQMVRKISDGKTKKVDNGVYHVSAQRNVAMRLYGINKWANENDVDIVIHLHFNDYPRRDTSVPGKYSGFTIYVPEKQYPNSTTTKVIATNLFKRLDKYSATSDLPGEDSGVVEEQELIAIGSNNTLSVPSMLIEYGYIYEPQITDKIVRDSILKDLAFQTYLGIQDFFGAGNDVSLSYDTFILPYDWKNDITKDNFNKNDVLALQTALLLDGVYPGDGKTKNDCPRTGKFGPCTISAVSGFQRKYGIKGETGMVGEKTRGVLNNLHSLQLK